ncbi:Translation initiation factor eIF-2B subunit gamma [Kickxella alabastrina]|nr:Translation initiation factor eIF-2B subunit gamma [Kickxella alabastrina]
MFGATSQPYDAREPEFKAVVLTMSDNDMYPLTERNNMTKALLPIANKPMLWYILQWLEQGGILDIKIVTTRESEADISNYIEVYKGMSNITVKGLSEVSGSADALRQLAPQIKGDVIVVPCDLLIDVPAVHFLDLFRIRRPAMATMFYEVMRSEGGGGSSKARVPLPVVGIDQPTSRLVLLEDVESDEELQLPMSLIRRFPSMAVSDKMQDSHVYVLQKWLLDYIVNNTDIESLQDDLLPLLVSAQSDPELFESSKLEKYMLKASSEQDVTDDHDAAALQFELSESAAKPTNPTSSDSLQVFVYIRRGGIAGRADQIPQYCDLNYIATKLSIDPRVEESAELLKNVQVSADSMVGQSSKLGERCLVKRSVIGPHCIIGHNVKITNSVIMDHVTIGDNAVIESSILCKEATIPDGFQIINCEIGAKVSVFENSSLNKKTRTVDDYM